MPKEQLARQIAPKEEKPRLATVVDESDFVPETLEVTDDDFVSEDEDRASGEYTIREKPEAGILQKEDVVEAIEFKSFNGIEGAISMQKKKGRGPEERNEDNVVIFEDPEIGTGYGVCDGLGEEKEGDAASKKVEEILGQRIEEAYADTPETEAGLKAVAETLSFVGEENNKVNLLDSEKSAEEIERLASSDPEILRKTIALSNALKRTNQDVVETGGKTTVCFTLIHRTKNGKRFAITANIGDSGAVLRKKDGTVYKITKEDSSLNEAIERGIIPPKELEKMKAEPSTYAYQGRVTYEYLKRANSQALGGELVEPTFKITELEGGDEIYHVTDGVLDFFETKELDTDTKGLSEALRGETLKERIDRLREVTNQRMKIAEGDEEAFKDTDDIAIATIRIPEAE